MIMKSKKGRYEDCCLLQRIHLGFQVSLGEVRALLKCIGMEEPAPPFPPIWPGVKGAGGTNILSIIGAFRLRFGN